MNQVERGVHRLRRGSVGADPARAGEEGLGERAENDSRVLRRAINAVSKAIDEIGGLIGYAGLVVVGVALMVGLIALAVMLVVRMVSIGPS